MTAKQMARQSLNGCGDFQDFATHQAAYAFLRRVRRHICEFSDTEFANTSVEKKNDGTWRARVSASYEA